MTHHTAEVVGPEHLNVVAVPTRFFKFSKGLDCTDDRAYRRLRLLLLGVFLEDPDREIEDREACAAPEPPTLRVPARLTFPGAPPAWARRPTLSHPLLFAEAAIVQIHRTSVEA
jgi:hypothetical protein